MIKEEWKEITRLAKLPDDKPESTFKKVLVSNLGNVKRPSYKKWNINNNSYSTMKEYDYIKNTNRGKQRFDSEEKVKKTGLYQSVNINNKVYSVHRLVAEAFIPNPNNLQQVNHIDGNRSNNNVDNLEWCTNKHNMNHAIENKLMNNKGKFHSLSEEDKIKIIELRRLDFTTNEIENEVNTSHETLNVYLNQFYKEENKKILSRINKFSHTIKFIDKGIREVDGSFSYKNDTHRTKTTKSKEQCILDKHNYLISELNSNSNLLKKWYKIYIPYLNTKEYESVNNKIGKRTTKEKQFESDKINLGEHKLNKLIKMRKQLYSIDEINDILKVSKGLLKRIMAAEPALREYNILYTKIRHKCSSLFASIVENKNPNYKYSFSIDSKNKMKAFKTLDDALKFKEKYIIDSIGVDNIQYKRWNEEYQKWKINQE